LRETFLSRRVVREYRQEEMQMATQSCKPETKDKAKDTAEGMMDRAAETARGAADQASDLADRALEHGRDVAVMAQRAPGAMREAVNKSLRDQPMATLAIAGALGFLLGAVWKS
jgi:ElaB/YqjD/DUF883 family membrane-anchored ribosome-binding protein